MEKDIRKQSNPPIQIVKMSGIKQIGYSKYNPIRTISFARSKYNPVQCKLEGKR